MSTIQTYTGRLIDLRFITNTDICIDDLVHGIANVKRFNGRGVSVLVHTLAMFDYEYHFNDGNMREKMLKAVLLHDLAEAYTGDIIQPVKIAVPGFAELENQVQNAILGYLFDVENNDEWQNYLPSSNLSKSFVKRIDLIALAAEYPLVFGDDAKHDEVWGINSMEKEKVLFIRESICKYNGVSQSRLCAILEYYLLRIFAGLPLSEAYNEW